jgi:hypothetical protein
MMAVIRQFRENYNDFLDMLGDDNIDKLQAACNVITKLSIPHQVMATEIVIDKCTERPSVHLNIVVNSLAKCIVKHYDGDRDVLKQTIEGIMETVVALEEHNKKLG